MRGDLAQPAAAGYHDGKDCASVRNYPPSGGGGEKEGRQTESAAISDDERKNRGGTRTVPHGRAGSLFPPAISASAKAAKIKRKRALKKWRATPVNHPALGARLRAPARAGILAPSPTSESLTPSRRKPQAPTHRKIFSTQRAAKALLRLQNFLLFFPNTDDLTPPAHTTQ